ncbi:MAG: hypothetical protein ACOY0T_00570 [Myxococcota bacterium]
MMMIRISSRWSLAVAVAVAVFSSGAARADGSPQFLFGTLTTHQVECATLCTEGTLTGGLSGTLQFTMTSMTPTSNPDVFDYRGVNVITTAQGTITGEDHGLWNVATGEFFDYTPLTGGTGTYTGLHGTLTIVGTFDLEAGGYSQYFATLSN